MPDALRRPADFFGIGTALRSFCDHLEQQGRATGRTQRLIDAVADGDRIICSNSEEVRHLRHRLTDAGKSVEVRVCPPDAFPLSHIGTSRGRTWFEHTWIEAFYRHAIAAAERDILSMEAAMSKRHPSLPPTPVKISFYNPGWDPTGGAT